MKFKAVVYYEFKGVEHWLCRKKQILFDALPPVGCRMSFTQPAIEGEWCIHGSVTNICWDEDADEFEVWVLSPHRALDSLRDEEDFLSALKSVGWEIA